MLLMVNIDIKGDQLQFNIKGKKKKKTPTWALQRSDEASSLPSYLLSVQACRTP